jgi:hypothetical protein
MTKSFIRSIQTSLQGLNGRLGFKGPHEYEHEHDLTGKCHNHERDHGHIEPKPLIFKVRPV